ncbi:MAG: DUF2961 domain-containing protein [Planctomycetes bacterium]|nr:DUF2961 domain-containing protein [Planctomycetota bacterium]
MRQLAVFGWVSVLLLTGQLCAQTVSFESLLDEMVDRDVLARVPLPAYTCAQASSYDRGSVAPDQPGWFANMDRSFFVRTEEKDGRKEYVMMDVEGPGAVVRFWATWHGPRGQEFSNGTLRFYLDNQPEPVIEGPIASILDGGGLITGPLSQGVSPATDPKFRGHNLYLPIPYARHCKITYETAVPVDPGAHEGEALYYQINYRTYGQGTSVEPFKLEQLAAAKEKLDTVQKSLLQPALDETVALKTSTFEGPLAGGKTRTLVVDHPGTIRGLTFNLRAENQPQALQSTILALEFDGKQTVWCPIGTFFGRGYKSEPHRTWYTEVTEDGRMSCYWVMPFQKECRISLINLMDTPVDVVDAKVNLGEWKWDERSMHFHGSWRQLTKERSFRDADAPGAGAFDVNYVEVTGQGVYVGDTLAVFNGGNGWWGEGDEKIYVDGETFPSHIGTGTEDYYGYAWCKPEFFQAPFHAQPIGEGNLKPGYSVNSRYRSLDAIPFTKTIKTDMELWHWLNTVVNFAPAAFWYARPGATWNVQPDPKTAALPVALKRSDVVETFHVKNAVEGEDMKIVETTGGKTENQVIGDLQWSGDTQLWWIDGKVGDRLLLEFPVEKAGRYEVFANLTKAVDYGIVKISVNDNTPCEFDRFHGRVAHDRLSLGTFELPQGANRLTVEITGANERAIKRHMFGLDYLQLTPR